MSVVDQGRVPNVRREARPSTRPRPAAAVLLVQLFLVLAVGGLQGLEGPRSGATADVARSQAAAGRAEERTPSPDESRPAIPPVPRTLGVTTEPPGAALTIRSVDGSVQTATTPFSGMVLGGELDVSVALAGYNEVTEELALDGDRVLELWLDPEGLLHRSLGTFTTGSNPKQVAFSPDGDEIWVSLLGGAGLEVFDAATRQPLGAVDLGDHGAVEVIFSRDGKTAFASQMETASVFEIERATRRIRRQLPTGGVWSKVMALSPDEKTLYVANWSSDDVSEIDLATGQVRRVLPTVRTPRGLYPTPDGRRLFVAGYEDGELARINLSDGRADVLLRTGGAMRHLVGDARGTRLYADDMGTNQTFVVDLDTEEVRPLAPTDELPNTIDLSPDARVLYVSNRGANGASYYRPGPEWGSVLAIDTATGTVMDAIVGGNQTTGLDVSPNGRVLAFSDFLDNRVRLYAIPSYEALAGGGGGRAVAHRADLRKQ